jgi:hypothetical protein
MKPDYFDKNSLGLDNDTKHEVLIVL